MLRYRILGALLCSLGVSSAIAQPSAQQPFTELRADGNGIAALNKTITTGFAGTSGAALSSIAVSARLNLTYDPTLAALDRRVNIPASSRTAARALLEVAHASQLRIRVSPQGQVVVDAAPAESAKPNPLPVNRDTALATMASLPTRDVQSDRAELAAFKSTVGASSYIASANALRAVPSFVEPDVLRAVQLLPGVEARSDWTATFSVRGGEGDQTLVLLDGFPIFNPFHVGGVFSTFIDGAVSGVELHTGAIPARFGSRLSGVLDVQSLNPTETELKATLNVSLVSASGTLRKAFANDNGGWMVGVRRTYVDAVLGPLLSSSIPYHFEDLNARLTRNIGAGFRLGMTAYLGQEEVAPQPPSTESGGWNNVMIGTSLRRPFHRTTFPGLSVDSSAFEQRLSWSRFRAGVHYEDFDANVNNFASDTRVAGSFTVFRPSTTTSVGYDLASQRFDFSAGSHFQEFAGIIPFESLAQRTTAVALYANHTWSVRPSLLLETGARLERNTVEAGVEVSPRISLKYFLTPNLALKAGGGRYTQWMHSLGRDEEPLQPFQFWTLSDSARGVSTARDVVLGLEHWMSSRRLLTISTFYKQYDRVLVPNHFSDPATAHDAYIAANGTSRGAELMLRELDGGKFSGWLSYSFARSVRTNARGETYVPGQDRRHNLNLVGSWHRNKFTLGARLNVASGYPYTPLIGGFARNTYDPLARQWHPDQSGILTILGAQSSLRTPVYKRVDLSASRRGRLFGQDANFYFSVVNALNSQNDAAYFYSFNRTSTAGSKASFPNMPILPTFGVKLGN